MKKVFENWGAALFAVGFVVFALPVKADINEFNPSFVARLPKDFMIEPRGCRRVIFYYNKYDRAYRLVCPSRSLFGAFGIDLGLDTP